jgi:hypothetical protein
MIRTIPSPSWPWTSWTMPTITRMTAMIHRIVAMALRVPARRWRHTSGHTRVEPRTAGAPAAAGRHHGPVWRLSDITSG